MMNCITAIAVAARRDYITPDDVAMAVHTYDIQRVRCDLLEVIGLQTRFGVEDDHLCAFLAWRGRT